MLPENQIKKIVLSQFKKLAYIAADRGAFGYIEGSRLKKIREKRIK